jgi:hypothetical protein
MAQKASKGAESRDEGSGVTSSGEKCWESRWQRNAVPEMCKTESCVMGIGESVVEAKLSLSIPSQFYSNSRTLLEMLASGAFA